MATWIYDNKLTCHMITDWNILTPLYTSQYFTMEYPEKLGRFRESWLKFWELPLMSQGKFLTLINKARNFRPLKWKYCIDFQTLSNFLNHFFRPLKFSRKNFRPLKKCLERVPGRKNDTPLKYIHLMHIHLMHCSGASGDWSLI